VNLEVSVDYDSPHETSAKVQIGKRKLNQKRFPFVPIRDLFQLI